MKLLIQALAALVLCVSAAAAGYGLYRWLAPQAGGGSSTEQAANVELPGLDGKTYRLADYHGKLVLVNFWATWCPPCMREIPMLVDYQTRYGAQGFQVLGPALDQADSVRAALPQLGINYPVMSGDLPIMNAMEALGERLGALPYSVLIATDGRILLRKHGEFSEAELQQLIDTHLGAG